MPSYAYERTCRRLAHRINSNTPRTRVTRHNVSLVGGPEWSNETVQNSVIVRVTARGIPSRNTIHSENVLFMRLLTLSTLLMHFFSRLRTFKSKVALLKRISWNNLGSSSHWREKGTQILDLREEKKKITRIEISSDRIIGLKESVCVKNLKRFFLYIPHLCDTYQCKKNWLLIKCSFEIWSCGK